MAAPDLRYRGTTICIIAEQGIDTIWGGNYEYRTEARFLLELQSTCLLISSGHGHWTCS